jgi:transcriptional regulator with XRE-family HTH domain
MSLENPIRDIRESKNLSQDTVAAACGLTYSVFYRIEQGSGKTTQAEVDKVVKVLNKMKPGNRKLAGRPFGDPKVQQAVQKARENGQSVAAVLASSRPTAAPEPKKESAPRRSRSKGSKAKAESLI